MPDQATLNRIWSRTVLEELHRLGVEHVCAAPGSRSTPLVLEAQLNAKLTLHQHFDERGLGFLALGMAKASQQPVAVIVTSGTAVANLLPAVVEANLTGVPLVLLTADRPAELVGCGANQAIDQIGIFSQHVSACLNLPNSSKEHSLRWLLTSVDEVARHLRNGPVHINCPYKEPLYGEPNDSVYQDYLVPIAGWKNDSSPYTKQYDTKVVSDENLVEQWIDSSSNSVGTGVLIAGDIPVEVTKQLSVLAKRLGWPLLCDPQSGGVKATDDFSLSCPIKHFDLWLASDSANSKTQPIEHIVQFGGRLVSKRLNQWLKDQVVKHGTQYWLVDSQSRCNNPNHLPQSVIHGDYQAILQTWFDALANHQREPNSLVSRWRKFEKHCRDSLDKQPLASQLLSEISVAKSVEQLTDSTQLFIGNSLIVRWIDMYATLPGISTYSNRGASGIDGLIATAAGVHSLSDRSTVVMLGDTSLLYDLNSLALFTAQKASRPSVIVVINNDGGAIFDMLPVPDQQKTQLYQMPHGLKFEHAALQFGLQYLAPTTLQQYQQALSQHLDTGSGTLLIEACVPSNQATTFAKSFNRELIESLC